MIKNINNKAEETEWKPEKQPEEEEEGGEKRVKKQWLAVYLNKNQNIREPDRGCDLSFKMTIKYILPSTFYYINSNLVFH